MTRKRFVKLLMSKGYSRNGANAIAKAVQHLGTPYENEYIKLVPIHYNLFVAIQEALDNIKDSFQQVGKAVTNALAAITVCYAKIIDAAIAEAEENKE